MHSSDGPIPLYQHLFWISSGYDKSADENVVAGLHVEARRDVEQVRRRGWENAEDRIDRDDEIGLTGTGGVIGVDLRDERSRGGQAYRK